jgi:hypothetical protein
MAIKETRFPNYYIDDTTFKVYSNKTGKLKPLKQSFVTDTRKKNPKKYIQVGVKGCTLLHRLIADTFIKNVDGLTVNHIDGDTLNNTLTNLEVVTQKENQLHAVLNGLCPSGEKHGKAKYTDDLLKVALNEINLGASVRGTAKKYGISQSYLNKVKNGVYRAYLTVSN